MNPVVLILAVLHASALALPPGAPWINSLKSRGFFEHKTEHFSILCDLPESAARRYGATCETTYALVAHACREWGFPLDPAAARLTVAVFADAEEYAQFTSQFAGQRTSPTGFYSPAADLAMFAAGTAPGSKGLAVGGTLGESPAQAKARDKATELVLRHEIAHQVLYRAGVHRLGVNQPIWLVEGLACQFETNGAASGRRAGCNEWRLADFRNLSAAPDMKALIAPVGHPDHDDASTIYAQAWALVFYLRHEHPTAFKRYLAGLAARPARPALSAAGEIEAFESSFGRIDDVEKAWIAAMRALNCDGLPLGLEQR
jgi:hypothetical protein